MTTATGPAIKYQKTTTYNRLSACPKAALISKATQSSPFISSAGCTDNLSRHLWACRFAASPAPRRQYCILPSKMPLVFSPDNATTSTTMCSSKVSNPNATPSSNSNAPRSSKAGMPTQTTMVVAIDSEPGLGEIRSSAQACHFNTGWSIDLASSRCQK